MNKKYIIIGAVVLALVVLYFYFSTPAKGTTTDKAIEGNLKDPLNPYNHTSPSDTEPKRTDGRSKTKISQEEFNAKVARVYEQAMEGRPTSAWIIDNAETFMQQSWQPHFTMERDEAIWWTARDFINDDFYY